MLLLRAALAVGTLAGMAIGLARAYTRPDQIELLLAFKKLYENRSPQWAWVSKPRHRAPGQPSGTAPGRECGRHPLAFAPLCRGSGPGPVSTGRILAPSQGLRTWTCPPIGTCDPCGPDWRGNWDHMYCRGPAISSINNGIYDGYVTNIHLCDLHLTGPVPQPLCVFSHLREFDMDGCGMATAHVAICGLC